MKKLSKRNEAVNNTVEAFEAKITCRCECTCRCGCGSTPYATVYSSAKDDDGVSFSSSVFKG